jgi:hypothetical protein
MRKALAPTRLKGATHGSASGRVKKHRETPRETPIAGPKLVTPSHGRGKLKRGGNPGNRGGGRPPKEWTSFCQAAVEHPNVQKAMMEVMQTPRARGQVAAVALAPAYAVGKPVERVVHVGKVERVVRIVRTPLPPFPPRVQFPVATATIVDQPSMRERPGKQR